MIISQYENVTIIEDVSPYQFGLDCQQYIDQGFKIKSVYVDNYMYKAVLIKEKEDAHMPR